MSETYLDAALNAHRFGHLDEALIAYDKHLSFDSEEPLALYGIAVIRISRGDISGLPFADRALFHQRITTLDKSLAASSIAHQLLQQQYQDHARQFLKECEKFDVVPRGLEELQKAVQIPDYLAPTRYDNQLQRKLERYRPIESDRYVYAIDIVGGCNLRCPTCPVSQHDTLPKGLMKLELYKQILDKIRDESIDQHPDIWLFNWTEPLLHPQVDEFVEATHAAGMTSFLSTNLNIGQRLEKVMRAKPTRLKVSLSSLQQSIYSQTHTRGDIRQVITNLHDLAKWRDHYRSPTQIWIGHHLYRNTAHEQAEVKALADKLGFGYAPSPAILAPIERVMKMAKDPDVDDPPGLREQFLFDPLTISVSMAAKRSGRKDCELRFNMTAIQHDGLVNLCCATTQRLGRDPASFLSHTHDELENMKYYNSFCKKCMLNNLHLTIADR